MGYVNTIKQGELTCDIRDARIPAPTPADVGKVLSVKENEEFEFVTGGGGGGVDIPTVTIGYGTNVQQVLEAVGIDADTPANTVKSFYISSSSGTIAAMDPQLAIVMVLNYSSGYWINVYTASSVVRYMMAGSFADMSSRNFYGNFGDSGSKETYNITPPTSGLDTEKTYSLMTSGQSQPSWVEYDGDSTEYEVMDLTHDNAATTVQEFITAFDGFGEKALDLSFTYNPYEDVSGRPAEYIDYHLKGTFSLYSYGNYHISASCIWLQAGYLMAYIGNGYVDVSKQLMTIFNVMKGYGDVGLHELPSTNSLDDSKIYKLQTSKTGIWMTQWVEDASTPSSPMVETTWSELKDLRDAGELVPGMKYKITDYTFTTVTSGTSSAGHVFDIIVMADDENHLNENAFAAHHDGDSYFANNKLEAWQLWYSLDNDTTRFDWADVTNGKGVIYRMIDEFNNDIPYDFKNYLISNHYTFSGLTGGEYIDASLVLNNNNKVHDNVMREWIDSGVQKLNRTAFSATGQNLSAYGNTFGVNCYANEFSSGCYENTFGNDCHNNIFGADNFRNKFGDMCYSNTLANSCVNNTFGNHCWLNSLGYQCAGNQFGSFCMNNTLKRECDHNLIGNENDSNTINMNCKRNVLGIHCTNNVLGDYCESNILDSGGDSNELAADCKFNHIGSKCKSIKIGFSTSTPIFASNIIVDPGVECVLIYSSNQSASDSNWLQNIHIHSGIKGPSSSNRLDIIVPERGQSYSYDYYATNSVDVML